MLAHRRAACLAAILLLPALALSDCNDPGLVTFGTGVQSLFTSRGADGAYRVADNNTFKLNATCTMTGEGASTSPDRWRAQVIYCGLEPCRDRNMPSLESNSRSFCDIGGKAFKSCSLRPTAGANFRAGSRAAPNTYTTNFVTTISNAWRGATTYYYLKCFYLCKGDVAQAQERSASSFTLEGFAPPPSPPVPSSPPPSPPVNPEPAVFGTATASIETPFKTRSGLIYAPPGGVLPIVATCRVTGKYALANRENWPAQIVLCGTPPGTDTCKNNVDVSGSRIIFTNDVAYDGTEYVATYRFNITGAGVTALPKQMIVHRFFSCLYQDDKGKISNRAGASIDVLTTPRLTPTTDRSPSPPPARPPTRSPPAKRASGWGDPHFRGFDGARFSFHGAPNTWFALLASSGFSFRSKFMSGRLPGTTVMKAFEIKSGRDIITVSLSDPPVPFWKRLTAVANNRPVSATSPTTLLSGTTVQLVPARLKRHATVTITTGSVRIVIIQKWRSARSAHALFLDFNLQVTRHLPLPATGLLAKSYTAAVLKRGAAAAAVTAPAGNGAAAALAARPVLSASSDGQPEE